MTTPTLPGWLPLANRLVIALGKLGITTGPVHVLTIHGRTSGKPRATPVSVVTLDRRRYAVAGLPQADWARNARAAGRGELSRGRRRTPVDVLEVQDPELRRAVMAAFPAQVPGGVTFFVRLGLVEKADPAQFAAAAHKVAVFELDPGQLRSHGLGVEHGNDASRPATAAAPTRWSWARSSRTAR